MMCIKKTFSAFSSYYFMEMFLPTTKINITIKGET